MFDFLKKKDTNLDKLQNDLGKLESQEPMGAQAMGNDTLSGGQDPTFNSSFSDNTAPEEDKFDPTQANHDFTEEPIMHPATNQNFNQQQPVGQTVTMQQHQQMHNEHNQEVINKSLEVLNSKLDTIRVSLESINQRLVNLERIAANETQTKRQW